MPQDGAAKQGINRTNATFNLVPPTTFRARFDGAQSNLRSQSELWTLCESALCALMGGTGPPGRVDGTGPC